MPKDPLPRARSVLLLLFAVNLLNYLDRQVLYAVLPLVKADLLLSDVQLGLLASAFMAVYMGAAPAVAWLADRTGRRRWIAGGLAVWSAATAASGLARGFPALFAARAAVGVGESCFGSLSPSFVAEHFPKGSRARALAVFSMAIPAGSALGYVFGGLVGNRFGWRSAFLWAGAAGLVLVPWLLRLRDPRGEGRPERIPSIRQIYAGLLRNRSFLFNTLAMAAMTFSLGGLAVWMPTFLTRRWGMSVSQAGALFGGITVLSGVAGSLAGGWLADRLLRRTPRAHFLVSGAGLLLSAPLGAAALLAPDPRTALAALAAAEALAFLNMGPLNAVIAAVTPLAARSAAFAANIFLIHALGDALSPTLIGWGSDAAGLRPALLSSMGGLVLGGIFCLWGARYYEADAARAEAME